jgi:hypothetical protein
MISPHSGESFKVQVGSESTEVVLIKAMRGADFAMGYHNINVVLGNHVLRQLALQGNFRQDRKKDEIMLYKAWHDNGFITVYINKSKNKILNEVIDY